MSGLIELFLSQWYIMLLIDFVLIKKSYFYNKNIKWPRNGIMYHTWYSYFKFTTTSKDKNESSPFTSENIEGLRVKWLTSSPGAI